MIHLPGFGKNNGRRIKKYSGRYHIYLLNNGRYYIFITGRYKI
jgi:hypothetical protein